MSALFGEHVSLGQENGPEIELVVYGDEQYARYETPAGFCVIYDDQLGLFTYARLEDGAFVSTGVAATDAPPPDATLHGEEDPAVRRARSATHRAPDRFPPDG